jgi:16S rRNA (guanine1207-N2)-methyltransferase
MRILARELPEDAMLNTTALLQRHQALLNSPATLVVEADDAALSDLLPDARIHSDWHGLSERFLVSALPALMPEVTRVVIILPKAGDRLNMVLQNLAGQCEGPLETWLVGPGKGGIRGGVSRLSAFADNVEQLDSARHCKLFRGYLRPTQFSSLEAFGQSTRVGDMEIVSYPGVFSHGRLDQGTAELLAVLDDQDPKGRMLDMGCGAGALSCALASRGASVTAVDVSATAVAATRASLRVNGLEAQVLGGFLFRPLSGRFDGIWSNPPFHQGTSRTLQVSRDLIRQAPDWLVAGGWLTLVANRELAYPATIQETFGHCQVVRETGRFRVYAARRG